MHREDAKNAKNRAIMNNLRALRVFAVQNKRLYMDWPLAYSFGVSGPRVPQLQ
jgi:hypothetical protein